jgi:glucosamine-6-phosphate deaminase
VIRLQICASDGEIGERAAELITEASRARPDLVLGVATGSSCLSTYAALERLRAEGSLDLGRAAAFALDEYVGLDPGHPESYAAVIDRTVTAPLGFDPDRVRVPDGFADDLEEACARYEAQLEKAGGVDLQLLGIGSNGHIGFNEPGSSFSTLTHVATLTAETRASNARFFPRPDDVPTRSITEGLATIMRARCIVLIAMGEGKARALAAALEGPIVEECPASILQLHPDVVVFADRSAAVHLGRGSSAPSNRRRSRAPAR